MCCRGEMVWEGAEGKKESEWLDGWKYMQKIPFKRLLYLVFITRREGREGAGPIYGRIKCECHEILGEDYDAGRKRRIMA